MLKHIPSNISPELMKTIMEMGHGDELVLADANYPVCTNAKRVVRADGLGVCELLKSILHFFPLDTYAKASVSLMDLVPGDPTPPIWSEYKAILSAHMPLGQDIQYLERSEFYRTSKDAFAIVATGETALYGNIILKKGVVHADTQIIGD